MAPTESPFSTILQIENNMDHFPYSHVMDTAKREELEKAYRKEKDPRVAARMLAVHSSGHNDPITWPEKLQVSVMS